MGTTSGNMTSSNLTRMHGQEQEGQTKANQKAEPVLRGPPHDEKNHHSCAAGQGPQATSSDAKCAPWQQKTVCQSRRIRKPQQPLRCPRAVTGTGGRMLLCNHKEDMNRAISCT